MRAVLLAREHNVHPQLQDRVLKEVLWFATEVPRKYATRYRSVAAWDLQRKGERVGDWMGLVRTSMCGPARAVAFDCCPPPMPKRLRNCSRTTGMRGHQSRAPAA